MNFLTATALGGGRFTVAGAEVDLPVKAAIGAGTKVTLGIRPQHFEAAEGISLALTIDVVEQLGSTSFLYGVAATGEPIVAEQRFGQARSDAPVTIRFRPEHARMFGSDGTRIR